MPKKRDTSLSPSTEAAFALYRDLQIVIEYVPIGELKAYERNPRSHSKRQIQQIAESIRAFGMVSPLVVDEQGELIAGHGRLAAARLLEMPTVPVVQIEHLDDAQKRALRIADNRLAELAGWDREMLALEFRDLLELDLKLDLSFDLTITGFESPEIDQLSDGGAAALAVGDGDADHDAPVADEASPTVSRIGDVWVLGAHRIVCGDARSRSVHAALLGDERAAMGIHDAPYNVSVTKHVSKSGWHGEFVMGVGEWSEEEFTAFNTDWMKQAAVSSLPGAIQFAFMDWRHMNEMLAAGRTTALELKNLVVWDKGAGAMGSLLRSQHELGFVFKVPGAPHINNVQLGKFGRNRTNVWKYPGARSLRKELKLHPTPKPVALVADAIRDVSNRNDIVLDCFSGSGTTIIACAKTGRRARVIELDPHYVDVPIRRWESWSGETARHEATEQSFAEVAAQRQGEEPKPSSDASPPVDATAPRIRMRQRMRAAA
ncbi:site-specific DNA-methyltransferase [Lutibaculum baratangense]|uniref:site-specific DNA-methyltransferase (adenine-specific) n=1 Tax=Lutibaculum baratangense AMV1 TaxID=631454 RepID=V4RKI8_9HYPH|nr:DNA methyltransferase [Lutibaculum baratangense]ESR23775.1 prophage LambdaW4, DNA methylase [Lutibaculum baratangense AMV1]